MVNHFASLLCNIKPSDVLATRENYLLGDDVDFLLETHGDEGIALQDFYSSIQTEPLHFPLIYRKYTPLQLPIELQRFYNILFPETSTIYYKQFLLYCYLRLIAATDKANDVLSYDSRLSYVLSEISTYFRFFKNSEVTSNTADFKLLLSGKLNTAEDIDNVVNNFIVRQLADTESILVYSTTQKKYYNGERQESSSSTNMDIALTLAADGKVTTPIVIGDTGLMFSITGPFNDPEKGFLASEQKTWSFSSEAPLLFDIKKKLLELDSSYQVADKMLDFHRESCNISYENMWKMHYNDVYKFAGLLLAYVERVHQVWLKQLT